MCGLAACKRLVLCVSVYNSTACAVYDVTTDGTNDNNNKNTNKKQHIHTHAGAQQRKRRNERKVNMPKRC